MDTTTALVIKLATEALTYLETAERDDGETFVRTTDDSPEWMHDLCRAAHASGEFLPDDHRYALMYRVLDVISDAGPDLDEAVSEWAWESAPVYTTDLTAWLDSHARRIRYVDDARTEFGFNEDSTASDLLSLAFCLEARDVGFTVLQWLRENVDHA